MKFLVLFLAFLAAATASSAAGPSSVYVAKWGVPSFEDEACVVCQYTIQRVENVLFQRLDSLNNQLKNNGAISGPPSTLNPFADRSNIETIVPGMTGTVAEAAGLRPSVPQAATAMLDVTFEPSIAYKRDLIRSLRTRWGGSSILRYVWDDFLTNFCSQDRLPGIYVPICSMMYENARKMMKLIFYGFPNDQVCLMSQMCGKNSYFAAPTAVHDPVMSLYWNNRRGLDGFEGGIHGVTAADLKTKTAEKEAEQKQAQQMQKKREEAQRLKLAAAEKRAELRAARALEDAKKALDVAEKAKHQAETRKYELQVQKTRAELEARKRAEVEAREALAREANVRMTNLLPLSTLKMELEGRTLALVDASQTQTTVNKDGAKGGVQEAGFENKSEQDKISQDPFGF